MGSFDDFVEPPQQSGFVAGVQQRLAAPEKPMPHQAPGNISVEPNPMFVPTCGRVRSIAVAHSRKEQHQMTGFNLLLWKTGDLKPAAAAGNVDHMIF